MMNMLDTQDKLKNFSEEQLVGQMQSPTGDVPQFLVLSEIERRKRMRNDAQRQQGTNQTTVAQDAVAAAGVPQAGITDMAQALAPQTDMAQNTGIMSVAPQAEPQRMASGGVVKMNDGKAVTGGLSYMDIVNAARRGVRPSLEILAGAAPGLTTQQALDVQAMIDSPTYIPDAQSINVATAPLLPQTPEPLVNPMSGSVGDIISDYGAGVFGGRTIKQQEAIDAAREAAQREYENPGASELQNPAIREALKEAAPVAAPAPVAPAVPVAAVAPQGIAALTGGTGAPGGTGGGAGGGGAASSYEQALLDTLANREKAQKQDKWLALAQVGLGMMSSQNPNFFGAAGEAGLKGVESFRQSRDQYDNDRLKILGDIEQYKMAKAAAQAKASGGGGGGKPPSASFITALMKDKEAITAQLNSLGPIPEPGWFGPSEDPAASERIRLANQLSQINDAIGSVYLLNGVPYLGGADAGDEIIDLSDPVE